MAVWNVKAGWGSVAKGARKARAKKAPEPQAQEVAQLPETSAPAEKVDLKCPVCGFKDRREVDAGRKCGGACNYRSEMVLVKAKKK